MHGRLIFINPLTNTGLIFGADRQRYMFDTTEWTEPGLPPRNTEVTFRVKGDQAFKVKSFSLEDLAGEPPIEDDPLAGLVATRGGPAAAPKGGAMKVPPGFDMPSSTLSPNFLDEETKAPTQAGTLSPDFLMADEPLAASPGLSSSGQSPLGTSSLDQSWDSAPNPRVDPSFDDDDVPDSLNAQRATASNVYVDAGGRARPAWLYYLIGVLGFLLLLVAGFVFMKMKH